MPTPSRTVCQRPDAPARSATPAAIVTTPNRIAPNCPLIEMAAPDSFWLIVNRALPDGASVPNTAAAAMPSTTSATPSRRDRFQNRVGAVISVAASVVVAVMRSPSLGHPAPEPRGAGGPQVEYRLHQRGRGDEDNDQCLQHGHQLERDTTERLHPVAAGAQRPEEDRG